MQRRLPAATGGEAEAHAHDLKGGVDATVLEVPGNERTPGGLFKTVLVGVLGHKKGRSSRKRRSTRVGWPPGGNRPLRGVLGRVLLFNARRRFARRLHT